MHQKREEIHAFKDFFKAAVAVRKENLEKIKVLRLKCTAYRPRKGNNTVLYGRIFANISK